VDFELFRADLERAVRRAERHDLRLRQGRPDLSTGGRGAERLQHLFWRRPDLANRAVGSRSIVAFVFPDDPFGLAVEGTYVNSAAAVTAATAWRLPVAALEALLRCDPTREWDILVKLCHELREPQLHALILARHGTLTRLAMFVLMPARSQEARDESNTEIYLPMTRSDIGPISA